MAEPTPVAPGPVLAAEQVAGCAEPVVGWVFDEPVGRGALDEYLRQMAPGPLGERLGLQSGPHPLAVGEGHRRAAISGWAAKQVLVTLLLEREAARLDVRDPCSTEEWARRLEASGEISVPRPTMVEARDYFRANRSRYGVAEARHVHHLLVADRSGAELLRAEARDLAGLAGVAARASLDGGSRGRGGDLGWVERGQLAGPLEDAIFSAPLGTVVGPVHSTFGWHLVIVAASRPAGLLPFAQCQDAIVAALYDGRRRSAVQGWLERRLAMAVRVPEGAEHPLKPGLPGSAHRH